MRWTMYSTFVLEFLKVQLLTSYVLRALGQPALIVPAFLAFLAAFVLSKVLGRLGGRVILHWLLKAGGMTGAFLAMYDGQDWPAALVILGSASAYWFRGAWLANQTPDHPFCLARFDEGLWIALGVHSLSALTGLATPVAEALVYPLGFFSILSLGFSKTASKAGQGFSPRHSGLEASSYALIFLAAIVGLSLLVPLLVEPALWTSERLAGAAYSFIQYVGGLLDRLFALNPVDNQLPGAVPLPDFPTPKGDPKAGLLTWIFLIVLVIASILTIAAFVVTGLVRFFRYLASYTEKKPGQGSVQGWLAGTCLFWSRLWMRMRLHGAYRPAPSGSARRLYLRYQALGRRLGHARRPDETAREYAKRLTSVFPASAASAGFVVEAFEKEVYGAQTLDAPTELALGIITKQTRILTFIVERARQAGRHLRPGRGRLRDGT